MSQEHEWKKEEPGQEGYYKIRAEGCDPETVFYRKIGEYQADVTIVGASLFEAYLRGQAEWYGPIEPEEGQ